MNALDGDGQRLKDSAGFTATRDIVQFVPFSKYPPVRRKSSLKAEAGRKWWHTRFHSLIHGPFVTLSVGG